MISQVRQVPISIKIKNFHLDGQNKNIQHYYNSSTSSPTFEQHRMSKSIYTQRQKSQKIDSPQASSIRGRIKTNLKYKSSQEVQANQASNYIFSDEDSPRDLFNLITQNLRASQKILNEMRNKKPLAPKPASRQSIDSLLNRVKIIVRAMKENQNPQDVLELNIEDLYTKLRFEISQKEKTRIQMEQIIYVQKQYILQLKVKDVSLRSQGLLQKNK